MAPQEAVAVVIRTSSHGSSNSAGDELAQSVAAVAEVVDDFVGLYELDNQEGTILELKEKNINLKKQVIMFQKLMKDKTRLDRVVQKLEKENLIRD